MTEEEKKTFANHIANVYAMYGKDVTPMVIGAWGQSLKKYELSEIFKATEYHIQDREFGKWLPRIADVIRIIEGSKEDLAIFAWAKTVKALREISPYESVIFDDPAIHAVVDDLGGWMRITKAQTEKDLEFMQRDFIVRYKAYIGRKEGYRHLSRLAGIAETANSHGEFKTAPPLLIGDPEKAYNVAVAGVGNTTNVTRLSFEAYKKLGLDNEQKNKKENEGIPTKIGNSGKIFIESTLAVHDI